MAVTKPQVAELYVATFNRAPDKGGLNYWVNGSGLSIEEIAMSFFDQPETQALYPEGNTDAEFVNAIYQNLFNRAPDAGGLNYWTGQGGLGGGMHRSVMIQAVKNGAIGTDAQIIANKAAVGLYYADEQGLGGTDFSLTDITHDLSTVITANAAVDLLAAAQDQGPVHIGIDAVAFPAEETFDAGDTAYSFMDNAAVASNVVINNLSFDDTITFTNADMRDYAFANQGEDVMLSYNYNDEGTMNIIQLTGIVSSDALVYDLSSFTAAVGFDPFTV